MADQQADAAAEYAEDMGKMMEVARRIMKGGIVPASDEKKLMEFSFEMYQRDLSLLLSLSLSSLSLFPSLSLTHIVCVQILFL